jgi:nitric oxide reductase activation protein
MEVTDNSRGIFHYFTAGWNRDSIALKAAGMNLLSAKTEKKLMIVLTDAHPSDSQGLRNLNGGGFARDYDGEAAINDTAEAVYGLRKEGIRIAALVTGRENAENGAVKIYGMQGFTRIRSMDRLAAAAEQLICRELG